MPVTVPTNPVVTSQRGGRQKLLLGLGVLALVGGSVAAVLLLGGDDSKGTGTDASGDVIQGTALLVDVDGGITGSWDDCSGAGGYSDFDEGMALTVKGAEGQIVGSGRVENVDAGMLDKLVAMNDESGWFDSSGTTEDDLQDFLESSESVGCLLFFEAHVKKSDFYSIELAERGELSYSREELADQGYVVSFSLGDL